MELLKRIKDRAPEYDSTYEDLINRFTVTQGGRAGTASLETAWEEGKYFSTKYEIYLYALFLGLKHNSRIPLRENTKKVKFIEMKSWPSDLTDYAIIGVISKSGIDLLELESHEDAQVERTISALKTIIEEYANGGFDYISAIYSKDPEYFANNEDCFIDILNK